MGPFDRGDGVLCISWACIRDAPDAHAVVRAVSGQQLVDGDQHIRVVDLGDYDRVRLVSVGRRGRGATGT